MRAFIGITLPDSVRSSLASLQRYVGESSADVKWVEPDHLHVTLKFLDEITDEQRRHVEALLGRIASGQPPFLLAMDRVGAFPAVTAPRVLWVGLSEGKESVIRITESIEREGHAIPLPREERPFAAHVTLGRVRTPRNRQALTERLRGVVWQPPAPWHVTSVTLYQSVLGATGPRYSVLADIPLGTK